VPSSPERRQVARADAVLGELRNRVYDTRRDHSLPCIHVPGSEVVLLHHVELDDGEIALQIWLLVDGHLEVARLDRIDDRWDEVEADIDLPWLVVDVLEPLRDRETVRDEHRRELGVRLRIEATRLASTAVS